MSLAEVIERWIGKVEIVLAGAEDDLHEGEVALSAGDPMRARAAAHRVLVRAPDSPLALALLADACEAAGLDAELALTLEELSRRAPARAEVWVRLARARRVTGAPHDDVRDAFVRGLAVAAPGSDERRDALVELADLDLAQGDATRAELWLDRAADDRAPDIAVRRAETRLLRGDAAGANRLLADVQPPPTDGRGALARGRALAILGEANAFGFLLRALVLDTPGASEALASALGHLPSDPQLRARIRSVVDAKGEQDLARWRAAFARADGARDAARRALGEAVAGGDRQAALPLLEAAIDDRDKESLGVALAALSPAQNSVVADAELILEDTLDSLGRVSHPRLVAWADTSVHQIASSWVPESGAPANWPALLARLDQHARDLADLESVAAIADLSAERSRPVRVAVVGEFNAGKSTFINALIGADVAPTGVLPTTASLHHLRWAPDPIARILFPPGHEPPERIVALGDLRAALATPPGAMGPIGASPIRRVELLLPLPFLTRVEILDTPGFNAPDPHHTTAARGAFEEADIAIWLLDATQAIKQSEREVLDEARRARVPVQLLVNKADRLTESDLARVMSALDEALASTEIRSWTPPLALSAKKALAGKLGDAKALSESGWDAVARLLEEQIVARSGAVKERALRRRAARVVAPLAAQAASHAVRQQGEAAAREARARTVAQTAARVERQAEGISRDLAKSLMPAAEAWRRDLAVVYVGRDPAKLAADPLVARYRVERASTALAPPLCRALASLAGDAAIPPTQLMPAVRALVRAAGYVTTSAKADGSQDDFLGGLARAAVATLVEHLFAESSAPVHSGQAAGLVRELEAFAAALARG
jgi:small GTP-binding protein